MTPMTKALDWIRRQLAQSVTLVVYGDGPMSINVSINTNQKQLITVVTKNTAGQVDTTSAIQVFSAPNPPGAATCEPVAAGASNRDFYVVGQTVGSQQFTLFANGKGDQVNATVAAPPAPDLSETTVTAVGSPVAK